MGAVGETEDLVLTVLGKRIVAARWRRGITKDDGEAVLEGGDSVTGFWEEVRPDGRDKRVQAEEKRSGFLCIHPSEGFESGGGVDISEDGPKVLKCGRGGVSGMIELQATPFFTCGCVDLCENGLGIMVGVEGPEKTDAEGEGIGGISVVFPPLWIGLRVEGKVAEERKEFGLRASFP